MLTHFWLASNPLLDALITLFVIKQYRIQTLASGLAVYSYIFLRNKRQEKFKQKIIIY